MFDEIERPDETEEGDTKDPHWKIVEKTMYVVVMLFAGYMLLRGYGWLIAVIGSLVLTLAAFAIYQWVKVWLNLRRQERSPEDDGEPISLNLSSSGSRQSDRDDE